MTYDFQQSATIPATPAAVYAAWMSSEGHTAMIGIESTVDPVVGGEYMAGDGYIWGRTLELEPDHRIVQSWRTSDFTDTDVDSTIEVLLEPVGGGTLLTLSHRDVPSDDHGYEDGGWEYNYFKPMVEYFSAAG